MKDAHMGACEGCFASEPSTRADDVYKPDVSLYIIVQQRRQVEKGRLHYEGCTSTIWGRLAIVLTALDHSQATIDSVGADCRYSNNSMFCSDFAGSERGRREASLMAVSSIILHVCETLRAIATTSHLDEPPPGTIMKTSRENAAPTWASSFVITLSA